MNDYRQNLLRLKAGPSVYYLHVKQQGSIKLRHYIIQEMPINTFNRFYVMKILQKLIIQAIAPIFYQIVVVNVSPFQSK